MHPQDGGDRDDGYEERWIIIAALGTFIRTRGRRCGQFEDIGGHIYNILIKGYLLCYRVSPPWFERSNAQGRDFVIGADRI
jgi:hypothetical protein